MASSLDTQPSALGIVVLGWLLTRRDGAGTRADLRRTILTFLHREKETESVARLDRELDALVNATLVTRSPRGTVTLTGAGRETVLRSLDFAELPPGPRWRSLQPHLLACALDLRGAAATLATAEGLRLAVLKRWVNDDGPSVPQAPSVETVPRVEATPRTAEDLPAFASRVIAAARASTTGRYGQNKVFISHVWRSLEGDPNAAGLDAAAFKERLVEAHREGLLDLSRADLVEAMSPEDVAASETSYFGASFHFVRMDGAISTTGPVSRRSAV
jgi:hypothetical protein